MRVAEVSTPTKLMLASKVETIIRSKGKEVVQEAIQTLEDERLDLIGIDDKLLI